MKQNINTNALIDARLLDIKEWGAVTKTIQLMSNAVEMGLIRSSDLTAEETVDVFNNILSSEMKIENVKKTKVFEYTRFLWDNRDAILNKDMDKIRGKIREELKNNELKQD